MIGEVVLAMNLLQATLGGIFWKLIDLKVLPEAGPDDDLDELLDKFSVPSSQIFAVWNVITSDATQRNMMLAAAETILAPDSKMLERIKWIKRKADFLGSIRNDAAHLILDFEVDVPPDKGRLIANPAVTPKKRLKKLQEARVLENRFRYVAGDIMALQTYALGVLYKMADPQSTLPKRPRLRSVPDQD
jgi:hypothetical protein